MRYIAYLYFSYLSRYSYKDIQVTIFLSGTDVMIGQVRIIGTLEYMVVNQNLICHQKMPQRICYSHWANGDLTRFFGICDVEKAIVTFPPYSVLSILTPTPLEWTIMDILYNIYLLSRDSSWTFYWPPLPPLVPNLSEAHLCSKFKSVNKSVEVAWCFDWKWA